MSQPESVGDLGGSSFQTVWSLRQIRSTIRSRSIACSRASTGRARSRAARLAGVPVPHGRARVFWPIVSSSASKSFANDTMPSLEELLGHVGELDALGREGRHHGVGALSVLGHRVLADLSVVADRVHGVHRHRVDGVAPDQLLDVDRVAVGGVLRGGGGPQRALHRGAGRRQTLPPRAGEELAELLVRELHVGDRGRTTQLRSPSGSLASIALSTRLTKNEATDAMPAIGRPASARRSSPRRYAAATPSYALDREQQRDVQVDAVGDQLLDRGHALDRARDLDHHVRPGDTLPDAPRLVDRPGRVVCQPGLTSS